MKRFHVHLHVEDLQASIAFYSRLFGSSPARVEGDYAKWMLEDPRVNFAVSTRGKSSGLDHLGFQVDSADELIEIKAVAQSADMAVRDEGEITCCYARSEKYWITDPQGTAWEHFHTLEDIPVFSGSSQPATGMPCCSPAKQAATPCCTPKRADAAACCEPAARQPSR